MATYAEVLRSAKELTPDEQVQLRRELASISEPDESRPPAISETGEHNPMLAFIGSIDEDPVTLDDLDKTIYG